jgi:Protein of unknown function (DUF402)
VGVPPFAVGSTVVQRHVLHGRVMSAYPGRVLADDGHSLALAHWPGTDCLVNAEWATAMDSGRAEDRGAALAALARGDWELVPWTWQTTAVVHLLEEGGWFSINQFHEPASGALLWWYVNFQRPFAKMGGSIETLDLLVDLVAGPDLAWAWKDEEEYAHGRRLGLVTDADHRGVTEARDRALAMIEDREPPFDADPPPWRPDPEWRVPRLPQGSRAGGPTAQ